MEDDYYIVSISLHVKILCANIKHEVRKDIRIFTKMVKLSRDMRLHHHPWVVLLETEMKLRCNVVVSLTIEHARIGIVCGQTSFDST